MKSHESPGGTGNPADTSSSAEALMTSGGSLAVSVSENGSDWQTVANGVGSDATTSVDFGTQTARLRPY